MSSIVAGTTAGLAYRVDANTDGSLVFKTNDGGGGGTTALTLATSGAATFAENVTVASGKTLTLNAAVLGAWTAVAFNAGNFTGSGTITWTVASGDQSFFTYTIIGKTMIVAFRIATTTVAGTGTELLITIPASKTVASTGAYWNAVAMVTDNGAAWKPATMYVEAGGTKIRIQNGIETGSNWTAATDATAVEGQIAFEIL